MAHEKKLLSVFICHSLPGLKLHLIILMFYANWNAITISYTSISMKLMIELDYLSNVSWHDAQNICIYNKASIEYINLNLKTTNNLRLYILCKMKGFHATPYKETISKNLKICMRINRMKPWFSWRWNIHVGMFPYRLQLPKHV